MKQWWERKKSKTRKRRKKQEDYTIGDFILDILVWIPEFIIFPFRILYWLFRGLGRWIGDIFDAI
ncbi:hypothetical protein F9U64_10970 [Gracilibacillus oryzae]|uniref:Uncharacterized protein n=1 Tax=Gracilibacillus oryzae TaxID=1672701 RepID=A0A7C8GT85_9BACI|nr:hypothetical protein [Gracilibacillus oryzae]KAB8135782.1 hypothetical protein F9U64_10970 [Gracilibacillus oryzae]